MRQDFFEYSPQFKLLIAGNHKPGLRSVDEAIRRRLNLVPFTITIPPAERDPDLSAKLKDEMPGIMAWMVDGCLDWQRDGLAQPSIVRDATDAYLEAEDATSTWMEECGTQDPHRREPQSKLWASWVEWADKAGEVIGSQKQFRARLEGKLEEKRGSGGVRGWRGFGLFPDPNKYDFNRE